MVKTSRKRLRAPQYNRGESARANVNLPAARHVSRTVVESLGFTLLARAFCASRNFVFAGLPLTLTFTELLLNFFYH